MWPNAMGGPKWCGDVLWDSFCPSRKNSAAETEWWTCDFQCVCARSRFAWFGSKLNKNGAISESALCAVHSGSRLGSSFFIEVLYLCLTRMLQYDQYPAAFCKCQLHLLMAQSGQQIWDFPDHTSELRRSSYLDHWLGPKQWEKRIAKISHGTTPQHPMWCKFSRPMPNDGLQPRKHKQHNANLPGGHKANKKQYLGHFLRLILLHCVGKFRMSCLPET